LAVQDFILFPIPSNNAFKNSKRNRFPDHDAQTGRPFNVRAESETTPRVHGTITVPGAATPRSDARAGVQSPPSTRDSTTAFPISMAARSTSELESVAAKAVAMAAPPLSGGRGAASESIASGQRQAQARGSNFLEEEMVGAELEHEAVRSGRSEAVAQGRDRRSRRRCQCHAAARSRTSSRHASARPGARDHPSPGAGLRSSSVSNGSESAGPGACGGGGGGGSGRSEVVLGDPAQLESLEPPPPPGPGHGGSERKCASKQHWCDSVTVTVSVAIDAQPASEAAPVPQR
jgi:hypothetical protein